MYSFKSLTNNIGLKLQNYKFKLNIFFKRHREFKLSERINFYLIILIFLYIIIEIMFNYKLFNAMAVYTTSSSIENIEFYGKIVSGIGIALLIAKIFVNDARISLRSTLLRFSFFLVIGIAISFFSQKRIVSYIVDNSTEKSQAGALLVSVASSSLIPYVNDKSEENKQPPHQTESKFFQFNDNYADLKKVLNDSPLYSQDEMTDFLKDAKKCSQKPVKVYAKLYPINNKVDKAFFAYTNLGNYEQNVTLHQKAIRAYTSCMNKNAIYYDNQIKNLVPLKQAYEDQYRYYLNSSGEYNDNMARRPYFKKRIQAKWREEADRYLGFESTLPPNLSKKEFFSHRDVLRYLKENKKVEGPNPFAPNMRKELDKHPDFAYFYFTQYQKKLDNHGYFNESEKEIGKQAYKSMVIPMVGLGCSVFFLFLNIFSLISLIISDKSKKISKIISWSAIPLFFFIPVILQKTGISKVINTDNKLVEVIYFYQSHIILNVDKFLNFIKAFGS